MAKGECEKKAEDQVRLTNCAVRLLGSLRNGRAPVSWRERLAEESTFDAHMAQLKAKPGNVVEDEDGGA